MHRTCTVHYYSYMALIGMHHALAAWANASQLGSCTCNYSVGSCGPTHPSHPMTSSTTSASRYGPINFWLLSNCQQTYMYSVHVYMYIHVHVHVYTAVHVQYVMPPPYSSVSPQSRSQAPQWSERTRSPWSCSSHSTQCGPGYGNT